MQIEWKLILSCSGQASNCHNQLNIGFYNFKLFLRVFPHSLSIVKLAQQQRSDVLQIILRVLLLVAMRLHLCLDAVCVSSQLPASLTNSGTSVSPTLELAIFRIDSAFQRRELDVSRRLLTLLSHSPQSLYITRALPLSPPPVFSPSLSPSLCDIARFFSRIDCIFPWEALNPIF